MHSLVRNCVCFTEVVYSLNCVYHVSYNQLYGDNKTLENQSNMADFFVENSLLIS